MPFRLHLNAKRIRYYISLTNSLAFNIFDIVFELCSIISKTLYHSDLHLVKLLGHCHIFPTDTNRPQYTHFQ